jgi:hypothetical protein
MIFKGSDNSQLLPLNTVTKAIFLLICKKEKSLKDG